MRYISKLVFFLTLFLVSCSSTLWERSPAEVKASFAKGDYSFLAKLTDKQLLAASPDLLGDGAGFYMGMIFLEIKNTRVAEHYLTWSFENEKAPWQGAAGKALYGIYAESHGWEKAVQVAQKLYQLEPQDKENSRRLVEALYWSKQDEAALSVMGGWKPGDFSAAKEQENLLFKAVILTRLGRKSEAANAWRTLIFDTPASLIHYRVYSFFEEDPSRYELLDPQGREALFFQSMVGQGQAQAADEWLKNHPSSAEFWNHPVFIGGLESLYKPASRAAKGVVLLGKVKEQVTGEARFAAEFAWGRFHRSLEHWPEARAAFLTARGLAVTDEEKQRCDWNWLQSWVKVQPAGASESFRQVMSETKDPGYFSDVVKAWLSELVQKRSWSVIASAYKEWGSKMLPEDRASFAFVLARLSRHGLVDLQKVGVGRSEAELLNEAIGLQPYSYEALVARTVLGQPLEFLPSPKEKNEEVPTEDADTKTALEKPEAIKGFEVLADGYLNFGLVQKAGDLILKNAATVSPTLARRMVVAWQSREAYRDSLVLLYALMENPGFKMERHDFEMLFPQAFLPLSEEQSKAQNLDLSLLQGLMRTESSFDAKAHSWVGAQGLTQLMPETAAYTAKKLKLASYDLMDPHDNIMLGAKYLAITIENQERIFLALMAYNAGGARIRSWKVSMGEMPEELFVEGVPFSETRYYVKKVLSAAVMYGVLYHGKTLAQMVQMIYPNFQP